MSSPPTPQPSPPPPPAQPSEQLRVLELDYEKTTKLIEGIVGSSFYHSRMGNYSHLCSAGFTFQARRWEIAALCRYCHHSLAFIDAYHSWLYAGVLRHAQRVEGVLSAYYAYLSRGDDDPAARRAYEVAIQSHQFEDSQKRKRFRLRALWYARPRKIIITLYLTLLLCAIASGVFVIFSDKNPPRNITWATIVEPSLTQFVSNHEF